MSESEYLKTKFIELIKGKNSNKVIQLFGRWGIGKTHLWNDVINELDEYYKKKIVKVSLFDKNSVSELKEDILLQVYAYNNTLNKYGKHLDALQNVATKALAGVTVSSLSSLLKAKDFKDVIISFDDIERRNKKFDFDTFLGFVSLLKDDKKCNVILILNYDELNEEDKKIFDKYKEKIIDYNLILKRNPMEALELALGAENVSFQNELKEVITDIGIDNIRLIKHMIKMINEIDRIKFIYNEKIVNFFIKAYLYYVYIYYNYGIDDINSILDYELDKALNSVTNDEDDLLLNKEYDAVLNEIDVSSKLSGLDKKLLRIFDDIMKSHFISDSNLRDLVINLEVLSENEDLIFAVEKINQLRINYLFDMENTIGHYYQEMYQNIEVHKEKIVKQMSLSSFFYTIDILAQENNREVDKLEKECIEYYIKWLAQLDERYYHDLNDAFSGKSPMDFLKDRQLNYLAEFEAMREAIRPIANCEFINTVIKKLRSSNGYNSSDVDIINSFTYESLIDCLKSSPTNMHDIVMFYKRKKISQEFNSFTEKMILALKKLYTDGNHERKKKIERMFSYSEDADILEKIKSE